MGYRLDDAFLRSLQDQNGDILHILWNAGNPVASSAPAGPVSVPWGADGGLWESDSPTVRGTPRDFTIQNRTYRAVPLQLPQTQLIHTAAVALAPLQQTQQQFIGWLLTAIFATVIIGGVFGAVLANRISQPLKQLQDAAQTLRKGNLQKPVTITTRLREAAQVAHALEEARAALQFSLNQLNQQQQWSEHLLAAIVEGILTLDSTGKVTFF